MVSQVNVGMIGFSEGNGHPFSFSAIINGYDQEKFDALGWTGISKYLSRQPSSAFGISPLRISHVWMPDMREGMALAEACFIENVCDDLQDMISEVDAVIIARDDAHSHREIAEPFLMQDKKVFIDKPLTLELEELEFFMPFIENGQLMSCAGYRYAVEMDAFRHQFDEFTELDRIEAVCPLDWARYGVHMLDAVLASVDARPVSVSCSSFLDEVYDVAFDDGSHLIVRCLGKTNCPKFEIVVRSKEKSLQIKLSDNFSAFRLLLQDFSKLVVDGFAPISPVDVRYSISTIIAGEKAKASSDTVLV